MHLIVAFSSYGSSPQCAIEVCVCMQEHVKTDFIFLKDECTRGDLRSLSWSWHETEVVIIKCLIKCHSGVHTPSKSIAMGGF
jgi:hypothetical protein